MSDKKYYPPCGMMMFHVNDGPVRLTIGNGVELVLNDSMDSATLSVFMSVNKLKELQAAIKGALKTWQRTQAACP